MNKYLKGEARKRLRASLSIILQDDYFKDEYQLLDWQIDSILRHIDKAYKAGQSSRPRKDKDE